VASNIRTFKPPATVKLSNVIPFPGTVVQAATAPPASPKPAPSTLGRVVKMAAIGAALFHGMRRNDSVAWGIGWGALAAILPLPVLIAAVALPPGYARKK